jgi:hypothetical protein
LLVHNTAIPSFAVEIAQDSRAVNFFKLTHCLLDLFMLQMYSQELAEALDSLSTFGKGVLPINKNHPS